MDLSTLKGQIVSQSSSLIKCVTNNSWFVGKVPPTPLSRRKNGSSGKTVHASAKWAVSQIDSTPRTTTTGMRTGGASKVEARISSFSIISWRRWCLNSSIWNSRSIDRAQNTSMLPQGLIIWRGKHQEAISSKNCCKIPWTIISCNREATLTCSPSVK